MATTITWRGGDGVNEILPANSGDNDTLGFFGAGFGFSIRVSEYNNTNFVTNDNGTTNYGQCPNLRYANVSGAYVASESVATELLQVDNSESTLRIRLNTDTNVKTQNASFRAFDRVSINNNPSGVTIYAAEINKPGLTRGSGDTNWTQIYGSGSTLSLDNQMFNSGVHDWHIGITVTPTSIGEKTNVGFYIETEFI
jgi:hypothetical protein